MNTFFRWKHSEDSDLLRLYSSSEGLRIPFFKKTDKALEFKEWTQSAPEESLLGLGRIESWLARNDPDVEFEQRTQSIRLSNAKLSDLSEEEALSLAAPPSISMQLKIESVGSTLSGDLVTWHNWVQNGQRQNGSYRGATILFGNKAYRLPRAVQKIISELKNVTPDSSVEDQTKALAMVKKSLQSYGGEIDEGEFLSSISITFASAMSIRHRINDGEVDFDPVLFGREEVESDVGDSRGVSEGSAVLSNYHADLFSEQFRKYPNTKATYLLQSGEYLLLDVGLQKILKTVKHYQQQDNKTKMDLISNPSRCLREAHEDDEDLTVEGADKFDPMCTEHIFVETREYSERVNGMGLWVAPDIPGLVTPPNNWRPEAFSFFVDEKIIVVPADQMESVRNRIEEALRTDQDFLEIGGQSVKPSNELLVKIGEFVPEPVEPEDREVDSVETDAPVSGGRFVLEGKTNLDALEYARTFEPRYLPQTAPFSQLLKSTSKLKPHQNVAFDWLMKAYQKGLPGVLLADDMGLGKTLQTLAFASFLRENNIVGASVGKPILIVAPTGLLRNWEAEEKLHFNDPGIGNLIRAYGANLKNIRKDRALLNDSKTGVASLDGEIIARADWVLTTYETLRDYELSFGTIPFGLLIFDEIQKAKNPKSRLGQATKNLNAEFSIGLTGTPVENSLVDLWMILDSLAPGFLGDLRTFMDTYPEDDEQKLSQLSELLLQAPNEDAVPVMMRRMKSDELEGLPKRTIMDHERIMPRLQEEAYAVVVKNVQNDALQMIEALHQWRKLSLHPIDPGEWKKNCLDYIKESARFIELFKVLDDIYSSREKVLIFLESRAIQDFLAQLLKKKYRLPFQPNIINGEVPNIQRQKFVDEFQAEPSNNFSVLIVSPQAGGVGFTMTNANHVIHLSRWWNPAVEDQCNDRIYRIGQTKDVFVHTLTARHAVFGDSSYDVQLNNILTRKRDTARNVLAPMGEIDPGDFKQIFEGEPHDTNFSWEDVDRLNPIQFERWVGSKFTRAGFSVKKTRATADYGVDLIVRDKSQDNVIALVQVKHKLRAGDSLKLGHEYYEKIRNQSAAYKAPDAKFALVSNAFRVSASQRTAASKHQIEIFIREEIDNLVTSLF